MGQCADCAEAPPRHNKQSLGDECSPLAFRNTVMYAEAMGHHTILATHGHRRGSTAAAPRECRGGEQKAPEQPRYIARATRWGSVRTARVTTKAHSIKARPTNEKVIRRVLTIGLP